MRQPVAFAQVREDPAIDLALLELLGVGLDVVMIASGGCTAAALVASGRVAHLHLVDANPAQMALARLKLCLLRDADGVSRRKVLGHAPQPAPQRRAAVIRILEQLDLGSDIFGDVDVWSDLGLDHCGRYEFLFAALRSTLAEKLKDATSRERALREVMSQEHLQTLFGSAATANRVMEFSRHFQQQIEQELAVDPDMNGPFLGQMLLGRFRGRGYRWLDSRPPLNGPELTCSTRPMLDVLHALDSGSCDFLHLSNILDWLSVEEARQTLEQAARVLRPGGLVAIRQLNSSLGVRFLTSGLEWQDALSKKLLLADRSFFYRDFHAGRCVQ